MSQQQTEAQKDENSRKEMTGWLTLIFFMLLFPVLFFACVYFPMWIGVAGRY